MSATYAPNTKPKTSSGVYWPELDGMRSFAFLLVLISHVGPFPELQFFLLKPFIHSYNLLVKWGWVGVDLFLALSGFLITHLLLKERRSFGKISFKYFFIRRVLRIWPLYYLMLIIGFFILPLTNWMGFGYGTLPENQMLKTYLLSFLFFLGNLKFSFIIISVSPVIASLWTVCLEEQFYLLWGGFLTLWDNRVKIVATLIILLIGGIITRFFIQRISLSHNSYYYNTLTHMDSLLLGSLCGLLWAQYESHFKKYGALFLFLALGLLISVGVLTADIFQNKRSIVLGMTLISLGCSFFLLSTLTLHPLRRFFSLRVVAGFGRITYGMYLFHYPILITCSSFISHYLVHPVPKWAGTFFLTLLMTFLVSLLSWKWYEKPFNDLRLKFSPQNSPQIQNSSPLKVI